jgi:hypothetical protein
VTPRHVSEALTDSDDRRGKWALKLHVQGSLYDLQTQSIGGPLQINLAGCSPSSDMNAPPSIGGTKLKQVGRHVLLNLQGPPPSHRHLLRTDRTKAE